MTQKELIASITVNGHFNKYTVSDAADALKIVTASITEALANGEDVRIPGLGTFAVKAVAARTGRNPATGEAIDIPAKKKVTFKAAKGLI